MFSKTTPFPFEREMKLNSNASQATISAQSKQVLITKDSKHDDSSALNFLWNKETDPLVEKLWNVFQDSLRNCDVVSKHLDSFGTAFNNGARIWSLSIVASHFSNFIQVSESNNIVKYLNGGKNTQSSTTTSSTTTSSTTSTSTTTAPIQTKRKETNNDDEVIFVSETSKQQTNQSKPSIPSVKSKPSASNSRQSVFKMVGNAAKRKNKDNQTNNNSNKRSKK